MRQRSRRSWVRYLLLVVLAVLPNLAVGSVEAETEKSVDKESAAREATEAIARDGAERREHKGAEAKEREGAETKEREGADTRERGGAKASECRERDDSLGEGELGLHSEGGAGGGSDGT